MKHKEHNSCEHKKMAYCRQHDAAYCEDCDREWPSNVYRGPYWSPYWGTSFSGATMPVNDRSFSGFNISVSESTPSQTPMMASSHANHN